MNCRFRDSGFSFRASAMMYAGLVLSAALGLMLGALLSCSHHHVDARTADVILALLIGAFPIGVVFTALEYAVVCLTQVGFDRRHKDDHA